MKKELGNLLVHEENSLKEVMKNICRDGRGAAIIVNETNQLVGIVTDGDIRRALIQGASISEPIKEYMNSSPCFLPEGYSFQDISRVIKATQKPIAMLPIVSPERTLVDVLFSHQIQSMLKYEDQILFLRDQQNTSRKVLITGGAGYIGSVLTGQLLEAGYRVKVLDKLLFGDAHLKKFLTNPHFSLLQGDTGNVEDVIAGIQDVDAVVHLAEIVGDPACAINPTKTQQSNFLSTLLVAQVCKYFNISRFVYTSSCSVYGASDTSLLHEESQLNPVSLYARMKIQCEKSILSLADDIFFPTILRLATVHGASPRMRFDLVVNTLTAKALTTGDITVYGGDQWRPFVHVADVSQAILLSLEAPLEKVGGEIFNVGSNASNMTISQIGALIAQICPQAQVVYEEGKDDPRNYKVNFSKIANTLGFESKMAVQDGVEEIRAALLQNEFSDVLDSKYSNHKTYHKINAQENPKDALSCNLTRES